MCGIFSSRGKDDDLSYVCCYDTANTAIHLRLIDH